MACWTFSSWRSSSASRETRRARGLEASKARRPSRAAFVAADPPADGCRVPPPHTLTILQLFSVSPKTKRKTYTFFHARDGLAAARSSEGGLALLIRK